MKLLVLDVEGTLFRTDIRLPGTSIDSTIWQALAKSLGETAVEKEVETHRRWMSGQYRSYLDWMKETISIHREHGLTKDLFDTVISSASYNHGVLETLSQVNRSQYELLLVSGGFRELAARAQRDLNIIHAFAACEYLFSEDHQLKNFNLLPCDFAGKIDFIELMLREYGLGPNDWVFVGDGANDVPIAKRAPVSVGYRPHPELRKVVTHCVDDFSCVVPILNKLVER
jgi:phosphoserine phosphatase